MIITEEMVVSFANMLKSKDGGDVKLAQGIMGNRDKSNEESEANFDKIGKMLLDNDRLFPAGPVGLWVIKVGKQVLNLTSTNNKSFRTEKQAKSALSRHLTKYIGQKQPLLTRNQKLTLKKLEADLTFNKNEYIKECEKKNNRIGYYGKSDENYFTAVKSFFRGGKELRDFLLENKIVEIVKI